MVTEEAPAAYFECPGCGSETPPVLLGVLGSKAWVRCRACGVDFHVDPEVVSEVADE
jgi:transcription elongation factor Elf1